MRLSLHEQERLLIPVAAGLARDRRARGRRLNHPEAVALRTPVVRDGARRERPGDDHRGAERTSLHTAGDTVGGPGRARWGPGGRA